MPSAGGPNVGPVADGIQEVSGSIPLISTKNTRFHLKSSVFLYFSVCFVLGIFALDNKWTTDLLNFFFLTAGRKQLWCIHYLLVKADWQYATDDDFSDNNILIVVNYDTGEVLDQFMAEESWLEDSESTDYWNYMMLNGPLVGSGYDGGAIVTDSETRTELPESEIAKINEAIQKQYRSGM